MESLTQKPPPEAIAVPVTPMGKSWVHGNLVTGLQYKIMKTLIYNIKLAK